MNQICLWLLFVATLVNAQTISRVVNAASFEAKVAPGSLALVYGTNLGNSTSIPVTVAGKAAAVVAASSGQLTIQVPFDASPGSATIQAGSSPPYSLTISQYAPALFTADSSGQGTLSAIHPDGSAVSNNNPAFVGETISFFATGLGATDPPLSTGKAGPDNPPAPTTVQPTVIVASGPATVLASVMAPGQVGVYRVTIRLSTEPNTGVRNIVLTAGGVSSTAGLATIPVGAAFARPVVSSVISATGIAGNVQDAIAPGSWVAIYGSDFVPFIRDWAGEVRGGRLPSVLSGVRVTIGDKPASIYYISPGQINAQAPDAAPGSVPVVVTYLDQASAPVMAQLRTYAPAFFQWGSSKYAVATRHPDNPYIGNPLLGPAWTGAKPGDVVILWGTGFGPTQPAVPAGVTVPQAALLTSQPEVTVGGMAAKVIGAALSPGLAGVYQIAIEVPSGVPSGDVLLKASIGGFATPDNVYVYIAP